MRTEGNQPAFANSWGDSVMADAGMSDGLTKREYFAAMAMQGIIANSNYGDTYCRDAEIAVEFADFLIEALNK